MWTCDEFAFQQCEACRLIYQNPPPNQGQLIDRSDEEYFEYERANETPFYSLMRLALKDIEFENLARPFAKERRTFLDIGCATGKLIGELTNEGWKSKGVEVCAPAARFGIEHRGVDIDIGSLHESNFADSSFSVVYSSHVIEHIADPVSFVSECRRIVADDGLMIVTTPNAAGLQARLFRSRWRSAIADHMVLYSRKTLRRLLTDGGFDTVDVKTWGGIAAGLAPGLLKNPIDRIAKRMGFGDVMISVSRPSSYSHRDRSSIPPTSSR